MMHIRIFCREPDADESRQRHRVQAYFGSVVRVMQALIRYLGARYPVGQVVFYRSV
jgi:hypothetical protein